MNGFYSLYGSQKLCAMPTSIQSFLREKIKASDFLVADYKGIHRLIGLQFLSFFAFRRRACQRNTNPSQRIHLYKRACAARSSKTFRFTGTFGRAGQ